jgi:uncharacterized protein (DUF433 family)
MGGRVKSVVVSNPGILGGTPVILGTRVPADNILAEVLAGTSRLDIFCHYPSLPPDGIDAALAWERSGKPFVAPPDHG